MAWRAPVYGQRENERGRQIGDRRGAGDGPPDRDPLAADYPRRKKEGMKICVVALGKIGLPLAVQFASKGHEVIGADLNERTVSLVNSGAVPFPGEADLDTKLKEAVSAGLLTATTDPAASVAQSEAVVVVVPLFVDAAGVPDFGWMDNATQSIAQGLRPGTLVSYETTLPVGTTRNRWLPMLEEGSGLTAGR